MFDNMNVKDVENIKNLNCNKSATTKTWPTWTQLQKLEA
jgi:hypothetical protein